jgi:hypothetical protein
MRTGPRTALACLFAFAALSAPAQAADSLSVFVDNNEIALGAATLVAAHAETDAGYGGGRVVWKFRGADTECAATPDADDGSDATGDAVAVVNAGAGVADVGGQMIQLDVGYWRICGWLVDDGTGATVASASTVVHVIPYVGSVSISVRRLTKSFQFTLSDSTSAAAHLYAALLRGSKSCPRSPTRIPRSAVLLVPRAGRFIGSDGGLGRSVKLSQLTPGPWRACAWLKSDDIGGVGPTSRTFSVPPRKRR